MELLVKTINSELKTLMENNVRLNAIGDLSMLPPKVLSNLRDTIEKTSKNDRLTLTLALSYSSRWEIVQAVKNIALDVEQGKLKPGQVNQQLFETYLTTNNIPDPELLIRTSGEYRISNFLLYQLAYTELYFTDVLWPDFNREHYYEALLDYQQRERRFGLTGDQIKKIKK
jgi:undecaprenyl diphosphate synthase